MTVAQLLELGCGMNIVWIRKSWLLAELNYSRTVQVKDIEMAESERMEDFRPRDEPTSGPSTQNISKSANLEFHESGHSDASIKVPTAYPLYEGLSRKLVAGNGGNGTFTVDPGLTREEATFGSVQA